MADQHPITQELLKWATPKQAKHIEACIEFGSIRAAARATGAGYTTIHTAINAVRSKAVGTSQATSERAAELRFAPAPGTEEPIEDLIERKKNLMARATAHEKWAELIGVDVRVDGPIGIVMVGDPHVDDNHCDIGTLINDLEIVGKTPGMFAGHVGDITNNWVGRLKALYANQHTTFEEGLRLTKHIFGICPNLFVIGGNHDLWNNGMDLMRFIVNQGSPLQAHGARLALRWPDGREIRVHARHDFPGKSQFSDTHGMKRELLFGWKDHILVAGHTHVDEFRIEPSIDGMAHVLCRVSGYKVIDDFANEKGFRRKKLGNSVALIINPKAKKQADVVKQWWDIEEAADVLSYMRRRAEL